MHNNLASCTANAPTEDTVLSGQGGMFNGDTMQPGTHFFNSDRTACIKFPTSAGGFHLCTLGVFHCCSRNYGGADAGWTNPLVQVTATGNFQILKDANDPGVAIYSEARASSVFGVWTKGLNPSLTCAVATLGGDPHAKGAEGDNVVGVDGVLDLYPASQGCGLLGREERDETEGA